MRTGVCSVEGKEADVTCMNQQSSTAIRHCDCVVMCRCGPVTGTLLCCRNVFTVL